MQKTNQFLCAWMEFSIGMNLLIHHLSMRLFLITVSLLLPSGENSVVSTGTIILCIDQLQIKLIPEYDREPNQRLSSRIFHDNVNVASPLLGDLMVSFRWQPFIESGMIDSIRASYSFFVWCVLIGTAASNWGTREDEWLKNMYATVC